MTNRVRGTVLATYIQTDLLTAKCNDRLRSISKKTMLKNVAMKGCRKKDHGDKGNAANQLTVAHCGFGNFDVCPRIAFRDQRPLDIDLRVQTRLEIFQLVEPGF